MSAATRLVHQLAGFPEPTGAAATLLRDGEAVCAVCATQVGRSADVNRALGANFTDRSLFRSVSDRVCVGCLWCCSGKPPATLRLWSVVAAPGEQVGASHPKCPLGDTPGLLLTNRADPMAVARVLAQPPEGRWVVSVAVSGQKHVLPYAEVNSGGGWWRVRMETATVSGSPQQWRHVRGHARALRALGVPESAVLAGVPERVTGAAALEVWREHQRELVPWHGSVLLQLALWTIVKGSINENV